MTTFPFDLRNPNDATARLVAADWLQDQDRPDDAELLRRLEVVEPTDEARSLHCLRRVAQVATNDESRYNLAYWPERLRTNSVRLIAYYLPPTGSRPGAWVAELYSLAGSSLRHTIGPEADSVGAAVLALSGVLKNPGWWGVALRGDAVPVHVVPIRLASEARPEWWEREGDGGEVEA